MPGFVLSSLIALAASHSGNAITIGDMMASVIKLTNAERVKVGARAVTENERLVLIAQEMAEDLAKCGKLSHIDSRGRELGKRVDDGGYKWSTIGENVAYGYSSPEAVVNGWVKSPGHYQNLSNADYTEIGVGITQDAKGRVFWVQVFARPGR